jgi:hypothetical protein
VSAFAELKAFLGLDSSKFQAGIKTAEGHATKFSKSLSGIGGMLAGAFSVGAIIAFGRSLMETADSMKNMAEATNATMGAMTAMKVIGAENNLNWDEMAKILGKVRDAQGAVVNLSKTESEALARLNINAEEFVGAGVDEALELMAKAYVNANGSAEALNAVNDIFGKKIGPKAVEMMKALAGEGLGALAERTKEATEGFNELAAAQSTIEKFFSAIQIGAAKAIGKISQLGEEMGKLSVENEVKGKKRGFLSTMFEGIGNMYYKDKNETLEAMDFTGRPGHPSAAPSTPSKNNADVEKMRANKDEVAKKKAEEENKKAQELGRRYHFKELKNQDDINNLNADYQDAYGGVKAQGKGINADNVARIGGSIGGARPGMAVEDRAIKIQSEQLQVQKDFSKKLQELLDRQDRDRDRDEG